MAIGEVGTVAAELDDASAVTVLKVVSGVDARSAVTVVDIVATA